MVSNHSIARGSYYRRLWVCLPALNDTLSRYKGPDVGETRSHRGQQPGPACVWDGDTEGSGSSSRACWGSFENTAKLFNIFPDS